MNALHASRNFDAAMRLLDRAKIDCGGIAATVDHSDDDGPRATRPSG